MALRAADSSALDFTSAVYNSGYSFPNSGITGTGTGSGLIPGMGGMNPTGSLAPATWTGATDNSLGGGSGVSAMPKLPTPNIQGTSSVPGADSSPSGLPSGLLSSLGATTIPAFPANTGATVPGGGVQELNLGPLLGFNPGDTNLQKQLTSYYGPVGNALFSFLTGGAGYSPQVATALINQMAPQEERARNQILESFGASGGRYSSPAAIGIGDYESSFSLGQQGILANLANSATDRATGLFSGILDTAHLEQANKLGIGDILSNLLKALAGSGKGSGGGSGSGGSGSPLDKLINAIKNKASGSGGAPGLPGSIPPANQDIMNSILGGLGQLPGFDPTQGLLSGAMPGGADAGNWLNDLLGSVQPPIENVTHTITDPITGAPIDSGTFDPGNVVDPNAGIDWFSNDFGSWFDSGGGGGGDFFGGFDSGA